MLKRDAGLSLLPGRYPGLVDSYDAQKRTCRVKIPGLTDGADPLPEAQIEYPIGDNSRSVPHGTEIAIHKDDAVWIAFLGGDPRYPIITGYRNPEVGNSLDWRRWHHRNIRLDAEDTILLDSKNRIETESADTNRIHSDRLIEIISEQIAKFFASQKIEIESSEIAITGSVTITGPVAVEGDVSTNGNVSATGSILAGGENSNHHSH